MNPRTRQSVAESVRMAFVDLGVVRDFGSRDKYARHYEAIANYLLSVPGTDEYKFTKALVGVMRNRGCVFVTPAVCANRKRMEEASEQLSSSESVPPERIAELCENTLRGCIARGICKTERNALLSPVSGLPAWFRIVRSGFDPEVAGWHAEAAREELANDRALAEYVRAKHPDFDKRISRHGVT